MNSIEVIGWSAKALGPQDMGLIHAVRALFGSNTPINTKCGLALSEGTVEV